MTVFSLPGCVCNSNVSAPLGHSRPREMGEAGSPSMEISLPSLWKASWPAFDEALTREDEVEIPVQVNGRLRGKVKVAVGTNADEVEKLARADAAIAPHLAGKAVVKRIFVPDKLLNLVVA